MIIIILILILILFIVGCFFFGNDIECQQRHDKCVKEYPFWWD